MHIDIYAYHYQISSLLPISVVQISYGQTYQLSFAMH